MSIPSRGHVARLLSVVAIALLAAGDALGAQTASASTPPKVVTPSDSLREIRMRDGSVLVGHIVSATSDTLVLVSTSGVRMSIPVAFIAESRIAYGQTVRGEYWAPDPNKTRLFFGPTARPIGAGKGYLGTILIVLPFVGVGIGDNVTIAGGAPVTFGQITPMYLAPKVTVMQNAKASVAVGTLAIFDDDQTFGVAFGVATFGDVERALTAGIGFGYAGTDVSGKPTFMLGGEARMSRRLKLITENYFISGARGGLLMGGARIIGDRLSTDIGVMALVAGDDAGCCVPVLNFAYSFGR